MLTGQMLANMDTDAAEQVARTGAPVLVAATTNTEATDAPARIGSVRRGAVAGRRGDHGTLSMGRLTGRRSFTDADMNHLAGFVGHVAVATELNRVHADQQVQRITDDHDRIGLTLNNHVIQRLFAVSLGLQGLLAANKNLTFQSRINGYVDVNGDLITVECLDGDAFRSWTVRIPSDDLLVSGGGC